MGWFESNEIRGIMTCTKHMSIVNEGQVKWTNKKNEKNDAASRDIDLRKWVYLHK